MTHLELILQLDAAGLQGCVQAALSLARRNDDGSIIITPAMAEVLSGQADKVRVALDNVSAERARNLSARTLSDLPDRPVLRNTSYGIAAE